MGWESHHSRSTHPRHLGQHSANLSPATPMCLLSSPDSDLFLSAQGAGFNRPYTLNNYYLRSHATQDVLEVMNDTEIHEMAKLGKQKKAYDDSIRDLDDVYFEVQRREEQRRKQGLPPLIGVLPRKYEGHFSTPEERWEPDDEVADPTPSRAVHSKGRTSSRAQILSRNKSTNRPQRKSQSKRAS